MILVTKWKLIWRTSSNSKTTPGVRHHLKSTIEKVHYNQYRNTHKTFVVPKLGLQLHEWPTRSLHACSVGTPTFYSFPREPLDLCINSSSGNLPANKTSTSMDFEWDLILSVVWWICVCPREIHKVRKRFLSLALKTLRVLLCFSIPKNRNKLFYL